MDNIEEKISALYDGELSDTEADEVLMMIGNDINLQNKLSKYALMSSAMRQQKIMFNQLHLVGEVKNSIFGFLTQLPQLLQCLLPFFHQPI